MRSGSSQVEPAVELLLRQPGRAVDARDAVLGERGIVALGREGDLVRRSARRLLTGVAESISTRVLTPSLMIRRMRRS